jgi:hypothetical protein
VAIKSGWPRFFSFARRAGPVFIYGMETVLASDRNPDIQIEPGVIIRRQMHEWFAWMDHILDVHRSNFVFRQPTVTELEQHKTALKTAIRYCLFINALIADPDSNDRNLIPRLQIRIRQLQDAYDTFHNEALSDEQADKILKQVFPE